MHDHTYTYTYTRTSDGIHEHRVSWETSRTQLQKYIKKRITKSHFGVLPSQVLRTRAIHRYTPGKNKIYSASHTQTQLTQKSINSFHRAGQGQEQGEARKEKKERKGSNPPTSPHTLKKGLHSCTAAALRIRFPFARRAAVSHLHIAIIWDYLPTYIHITHPPTNTPGLVSQSVNQSSAAFNQLYYFLSLCCLLLYFYFYDSSTKRQARRIATQAPLVLIIFLEGSSLRLQRYETPIICAIITGSWV